MKVVVTGASTGIGRASVIKFSEDGHEVFATARNEANLTETVKLAEAAGGGAKVHKGIGDVCVEADVQRLYAEAIEALGGEIDVLVLNAGIAMLSPLEEAPVEMFDKLFSTNVRGPFLWIKAALPAFKKRGSGQIVLMNSVAGELPLYPLLAVYVASKFALRGLATALRLELQGSGIKVGSVCPGNVDTPIFDVSYATESITGNPREAMDIANTALSPDDIADAVATISYQSPRSDMEKIVVWPVKDRRFVNS